MIKPKKLSKPQTWYGDEPSKQYVKLFDKSEVIGVTFTQNFWPEVPKSIVPDPLRDIDSIAISICLIVENVDDCTIKIIILPSSVLVRKYKVVMSLTDFIQRPEPWNRSKYVLLYRTKHMKWK